MKRRTQMLAGMLLVAGASGLLYADNAPASNSSTPAAAPVAPEKKEVTYSVSEASTIAVEVQGQAHAAQNTVEQQRLNVRKGDDQIRLDCVNDALLQLKGEVNVVDEKAAAVQAAAQVMNEGAANSALRSMRKAANSVNNLKELAGTCAGSSEILYTGDTQVDWKGPATDDPTKNDDDDVENPGYASPFM